MPNSIKHSSDSGAALQVTKPARAADLVEENSDGEPTRLAPVRVHVFDSLFLLTDRDRVSPAHLEELQISTIRDAGPVRRVADVKLAVAGNGYQVALPGYDAADFDIGDTAPAHPAPNVLVIARPRQQRLARDLVSIREEQAFE